ncbi:hypothetical protein MMC13_008377 [Lambiella insularis]|nr:hypothetical protein [Lambiella insularis]
MSLGMHKARTKITEERKGQFGVFLGGVTCSFRKEIKPYECFEIWTRVLTWDRKWLYLVSHVMRKGVVQPERYLLQPWKKSKSGNGPGSNGKSIPHGAIFATSVAKYVFKQGRMTIPPETMLEVSELLPKRPTDSTMPAGTGELSSSDPFVTGNSQPASQDQTVVPLGEDIDASLRAKEIDSWDWATMEQERRRGMGIADCMTGLDAVQDVFTGHTGPALGQF